MVKIDAKRIALGLFAVVLFGGLFVEAVREGVHDQHVCSATKNASLCELAFDAGEGEAEAVRQGNL